MQAPEFEQLMQGKPAKFADLTKMENDNVGLMGLLARAQSRQSTKEDVEAAQAEIKKKEVEIPGPIRFKINIFIQQQKELGKSDRSIRRAVQKKFNIAVV